LIDGFWPDAFDVAAMFLLSLQLSSIEVSPGERVFDAVVVSDGSRVPRYHFRWDNSARDRACAENSGDRSACRRSAACSVAMTGFEPLLRSQAGLSYRWRPPHAPNAPPRL